MEILGSNGQVSNTNTNSNSDNNNNNNGNGNNNTNNNGNNFPNEAETMFNSIDSYPINEKSYISDITESIHIGTGSEILLQENERDKRGKGKKMKKLESNI